jgi:acyl-CoA thioester hydrolase
MSGQSFLYETRVSSEWVDYNGHMNDAAYAKVFSLAVDTSLIILSWT